MRADALGAAGAQDGAQNECDDDRVVELAEDRDEVGDQIERHGEVCDQCEQQQLGAARRARVGGEAAEQDHAVRHEHDERARLRTLAGSHERADDEREQRQHDSRNEEHDAHARRLVGVSCRTS
jgi:hypothetical protein